MVIRWGYLTKSPQGDHSGILSTYAHALHACPTSVAAKAGLDRALQEGESSLLSGDQPCADASSQGAAQHGIHLSPWEQESWLQLRLSDG